MLVRVYYVMILVKQEFVILQNNFSNVKCYKYDQEGIAKSWTLINEADEQGILSYLCVVTITRNNCNVTGYYFRYYHRRTFYLYFITFCKHFMYIEIGAVLWKISFMIWISKKDIIKIYMYKYIYIYIYIRNIHVHMKDHCLYAIRAYM